MANQPSSSAQPTAAFVGASWAVLVLGVVAFAVGLWNATMARSEKGFYAAVLVLGVFAAISLQKSVRDRAEGLPVSALYLGLSWSVLALGVVMLVVGLWNSGLALSEKGFYGLAFAMTLFAAVAVQKNVRDTLQFRAPSRPAAAPLVPVTDHMNGIITGSSSR
ncbi:inner membrane protein YiaA [Actinoplanes sp. NPDC049668]|uniref:inner membrane protein YiaA n=1 Tax=unclassified Actinoplanes TaxID=2626549 RepID=UPI0033A0F8A0